MNPSFLEVSRALRRTSIPAALTSQPTGAMSAAQYTPETLEALLSSLTKTADPSHEEILKHANHVLKTSKGNTLALHTKAVAYLHLDRHEDALKLFESADGKKLAGVADLEHAYCLYKVGKLEEAVALAKKAGEGEHGRAFNHISAQAVGLLLLGCGWC
jgi:signal recognition particle subunit SRP72